MTGRRHEAPLRRTNPGGRQVWVARYTARDGKRRSAGTFDLKRDAQAAIDTAYDRETNRPRRRDTVGGYFETWTKRHPRAERTNRTNEGRIRQLLDIDVDGTPLRDMELDALRRRHILDLVDHMLTVQGRAHSGVLNMLGSLGAMLEDAVTEEYMDFNPRRGVKVRETDPRIQKESRAVRVWSWDDMHRFADASRNPAMVRVLSDCGLRLGELLALERRHWHGDMLEVRQTAWDGRVMAGTKTTRGKPGGGREVPVPPALQAMLAGMPKRIDTPLLFPAAKGGVWRENKWRRDFWWPACEAAGFRPTPHEFRHSFVSLLRARGVDVADLAAIAGHTVETATAVYTHSLGRSFDTVREMVG